MKSRAWQRQHDDYIVKQLSDFKARKRTNNAGSMTTVSNTLNDKDIKNLAHYLTGLFECSCGGRLGETGLPEHMHALLNEPTGSGSLVVLSGKSRAIPDIARRILYCRTAVI